MKTLKSFHLCNLSVGTDTFIVPTYFITKYVSNFKIDGVEVCFDQTKYFLGSYDDIFMNRNLSNIILHIEEGEDVVLKYKREVESSLNMLIFNGNNGYTYIFTPSELFDMFLDGKVSIPIHQSLKKEYDFIGVYDVIDGVVKTNIIHNGCMQYYFNVVYGDFKFYYDSFKSFKRFYSHSYVYTDVGHFVSNLEHAIGTSAEKIDHKNIKMIHKIKMDLGLIEKPKKDYTNCEKFTDEHFEGK